MIKCFKHDKMIICDKNSVYRFHFASCMNIIFNELRQQRLCLYNSQNKIDTRYFLSHILFLLLIYPLVYYFVMRSNTIRRA